MKLDSEYVFAQLHQFRIPGVSVAAFSGADIQTHVFGESLEGQSVTPSTAFQCASISKTIAAVLVFRLIEQGVLDPKEDINCYLQGWKLRDLQGEKVPTVTIEQILSHSGALTVDGFPGYAQGDDLPTLEQILQGVYPANNERVCVDGIPGERYSYSGGGTTILQKVLEDTLQQSFSVLAQKYIFAPLSMEQSFFGAPQQQEIAWGHWSDKQPVFQGYHLYPELAAAGMWSTPQDLARFCHHLQQSFLGKSDLLLKPETVQKMLIPVLPSASGSWLCHGFFLDANPPKYFFHPGWTAGFRSVLLANMYDEAGIIIMANSDYGLAAFRALTRGTEYFDIIRRFE